MNELKPCPFCGNPMHTYYDCRLGLWTWNCGTADCAGNMLGYDTEEEAAAALNRRPDPKNNPLTLDQFESVCEAVHNGWWDECKRQGRTNHPDMIPYSDLSERVKEYDRVTVKRVLDALGIAYAIKPEGSE